MGQYTRGLLLRGKNSRSAFARLFLSRAGDQPPHIQPCSQVSLWIMLRIVAYAYLLELTVSVSGRKRCKGQAYEVTACTPRSIHLFEPTFRPPYDDWLFVGSNIEFVDHALLIGRYVAISKDEGLVDWPQW